MLGWKIFAILRHPYRADRSSVDRLINITWKSVVHRYKKAGTSLLWMRGWKRGRRTVSTALPRINYNNPQENATKPQEVQMGEAMRSAMILMDSKHTNHKYLY